jgi:hypothetical protein
MLGCVVSSRTQVLQQLLLLLLLSGSTDSCSIVDRRERAHQSDLKKPKNQAAMELEFLPRSAGLNTISISCNTFRVNGGTLTYDINKILKIQRASLFAVSMCERNHSNIFLYCTIIEWLLQQVNSSTMINKFLQQR